MLSLTEVADNPAVLMSRLTLDDGADLVFRPLVHADAEGLAGFLGGLSRETRRMSPFDGYGLAAAAELCDAIARYDKLRLVIEDVASGRIVGLLEFGFDLVAGDIARYRDAGIALGPTDCRFGVTLADDHQGRGVGSRVFPLVTEVARRFGRERVILFGGVLAENARALRYYEKNGFRAAGSFTGADGVRSLDMIVDLEAP
ncbi:RimJ/RimL family protein N-acetyltransferase [Streptomyces sp. KhCrAH-43]|uniref:GNAT family N-acetyltransferase n=1 Tax=unclassified Streptomyces TaxID=2593676 RepID=UPI00036E39E5|nr:MULTISPECIES: GNAT family N-acetyltransferase [unclassified Streptomyces]MYS33817.1 GNAT family N-acetyltransferase [Streptomyces sp. SID4920]MYX70404.1 GNAT family N-acetyltransferase [Streptomyces sp. SID8373]RAJ60787.1 RimJ/RimL family protein N-acetyltransferase [Streptomyces sp. KhCrAH-43]